MAKFNCHSAQFTDGGHLYHRYYGIDCSMGAADRLTRAREGQLDGGDSEGSGWHAGGGRGGAPALKPRIYVYELPGEYNSFLLARRQNSDACALREYVAPPGGPRGGPTSVAWTGTLYGAEVALHEALLASPHRTLDASEADFFYVPAYGGCFISEFNRPSPRHWLCDECHVGKPAALASVRAMRWHADLLRHIRTAHPYWNTSGGADHLWPFTHDEGACYAPRALGRAILLVHWGRTHARPNGSSECDGGHSVAW